MSKKRNMQELINILAIALRHKIGSIVNENEIYAQKYSKDAEVLIKQAEKVSKRENWNNQDKEKIKTGLKRKLQQELENKEFLSNKKFEIMESEMNKVLKSIGLKLKP